MSTRLDRRRGARARAFARERAERRPLHAWFWLLFAAATAYLLSGCTQSQLCYDVALFNPSARFAVVFNHCSGEFSLIGLPKPPLPETAAPPADTKTPVRAPLAAHPDARLQHLIGCGETGCRL